MVLPEVPEDHAPVFQNPRRTRTHRARCSAGGAGIPSLFTASVPLRRERTEKPKI